MERSAGIASAALEASTIEHRWGPRIQCRARVCLWTRGGMIGYGQIRNISSSGAFIETLVQIPLDAPLRLFITGNASSVTVVERDAIVVRMEPGGIGVEWCRTPTRPICSVVGCSTPCTDTDFTARG